MWHFIVDAELDILANLIEADGFDENEPGNLDSGQDQAATMSANSQNMSSENKRKNKLEEGSSTTEGSVSSVYYLNILLLYDFVLD